MPEAALLGHPPHLALPCLAAMGGDRRTRRKLSQPLEGVSRGEPFSFTGPLGTQSAPGLADRAGTCASRVARWRAVVAGELQHVGLFACRDMSLAWAWAYTVVVKRALVPREPVRQEQIPGNPVNRSTLSPGGHHGSRGGGSHRRKGAKNGIALSYCSLPMDATRRMVESEWTRPPNRAPSAGAPAFAGSAAEPARE